MSLHNPFSKQELAEEKQKDYTNKNKIEQKIQNSKELNISKNSELGFLENLDIQKIKELNSKCVEFIFEDKADISLEILKKVELFLESNLIEPKFHFDKKTIIIILHNLACCYQKLKDFDNCIIYLDSVIYHFDKELEKKHQIKINEEYFCQNLLKDEKNHNNKLLGDLILELRFSAKFHLQMCAVLSQSNSHIEALKHAKLAGLICEDNLIKTYYLFIQMKLKNIFSLENKNNNSNNINDNSNNNKKGNNVEEEGENEINNTEKFTLIQRIVNDLFNRIINLRKHYYNINNNINNNNNKNINIEKKNNNNNKEKNTCYNSYLKYRKNEIHKYQKNITLLNNIRNLFGAEIKTDDWIHLLNIGNIMYLSPLNDEDLELESDPKYELLRDAILEKIVMLTVSYFCIAMEMKQLSHEQNNKKINGEFFHYQAIFFSNLYLPVSCPIVKHYINSYYKYYEKDLDIVPEGKIIDYKIDLIKNEIEINKDIQSFIRMQKINYSNNNNKFGIINKINLQKINIKNNKELENINNNNTFHRKSKIPSGLKLSLNLDNILNKNNANIDININNNSNSKIKKFSSSNDNKYLSNSNIKNIKNNNKYNIDNVHKNDNFEIIPSKNNLNIAEKSKIKVMPKFKLNFNNLNTSNEEKLSKDKEKEKNIVNIKERIKKIKNKKSNNTKTNRHSASINMLKGINFKKNKGFKTERPNSNKRPININDTLVTNKKDNNSILDINRNSYIKSSYNKHLSKTSRYKNKKSPTSNNKGKLKGYLTDRIIFNKIKNKSLKKNKEEKKNNNNYIYKKSNIGYLTQRELIHSKIKEKIGLYNDKNKNKGVKNVKKENEKINNKTKSNNKDLKKNKSFNKLNDKQNKTQINNGSKITKKNNNNSKIESNKKQNINKNKYIGKNVKNNLIEKFYNNLFLIELKDNSNYISKNYRNTIEFNKYGGNPDQIYNFNSLIKLKNPFKS